MMDYYQSYQEPLVPVTPACVVSAANTYQVPPAIILSVLKVEGGQPGKTSKNKDKSIDIGPMQINSIHLNELKSSGITFEKLKNDGCLNVHIGAYYIRKAQINRGLLNPFSINADPATFWKSVGDYNSRTPKFNEVYKFKVYQALETLPSEWRWFKCENFQNACSIKFFNTVSK